MENQSNSENINVKVKVPKRILHFSDGILEEFSSDDEVDNKTEPSSDIVVDPAKLTWGPWFWYKAWRTGESTLSVVDYMGEFFSNLFGITSPKYYFEIEEHKRREEMAKKRQEQMEGWTSKEEPETITVPLKKMHATVDDDAAAESGP